MNGVILYGWDLMQKAEAVLGHLGVTLYCVGHAVLSLFCYVLCVEGKNKSRYTQA